MVLCLRFNCHFVLLLPGLAWLVFDDIINGFMCIFSICVKAALSASMLDAKYTLDQNRPQVS